MKKSTIIFSTAIIILSLTAFGFINGSGVEEDHVKRAKCKLTLFNETGLMAIPDKIQPDFFYAVGPRFRPVKKAVVHEARSFNDFLFVEQGHEIVTFKSVSVIILADGEQTDVRETGSSGALTPAQLSLLQSADYSTNILVKADYLGKNRQTGVLEEGGSTPYLTIVPEKQARYVNGEEALIGYLKENSQEKTVNVKKEKLRSGKLYFTVTTEGTISNVQLKSTSGYPAIDKMMLELVGKTPGKWAPAENAQGEKVDQKLVFSFGQIGC